MVLRHIKETDIRILLLEHDTWEIICLNLNKIMPIIIIKIPYATMSVGSC